MMGCAAGLPRAWLDGRHRAGSVAGARIQPVVRCGRGSAVVGQRIAGAGHSACALYLLLPVARMSRSSCSDAGASGHLRPSMWLDGLSGTCWRWGRRAPGALSRLSWWRRTAVPRMWRSTSPTRSRMLLIAMVIGLLAVAGWRVDRLRCSAFIATGFGGHGRAGRWHLSLRACSTGAMRIGTPTGHAVAAWGLDPCLRGVAAGWTASTRDVLAGGHHGRAGGGGDDRDRGPGGGERARGSGEVCRSGWRLRRCSPFCSGWWRPRLRTSA